MFKPVSFSGRLFRRYILMFEHPAKFRILNLIGKYFFSKGISIKNSDGVSFVLDANDWITRIILIDGNYESGSTSLAKNILSDGGTLLDIGANFGLFTCIAASNNPKVTVIAAEPNYKMIPRLLNNIKYNKLDKQVKVINAAISDKHQLVTMEQPASDNLGTTVTKAGANGLLSVMSASLDFICAENAVDEVQLLKIDIEGNEFDVVEKFAFQKFPVKNVILEFNHLSKISFHDLKLFFATRGFECCTIAGDPLISEHHIPENNIWFRNINNKS